MKNYLNYIKESSNKLDDVIIKCIEENCYKPLSVLNKEYVMKFILDNFNFDLDKINFEELIKYKFPLYVKNEYGRTSLMLASVHNNIEIVKLLIDARVDVNLQEKDGWTALMFATTNYNKKIVKLLIDAGADINIKNNKGNTALIFSKIIKNKEIIELLKSKGAKE